MNRYFVSGMILLLVHHPVFSDTNIWTGAGANPNWNTSANWSLGQIPTEEHDVLFDGSSVKPGTINVPVAVRSVTVAAGYTNAITQSSNLLVAVDFALDGGKWRFLAGSPASLSVGGNMTVNSTIECQRASTNGYGSGRTFVVGGNLVVGTGGVFNALGHGFNVKQGPGRPPSGNGGGGHGGMGGTWNNSGAGSGGGTCYGSIMLPVALGSGGEVSTGGGAIRLDVVGDAVIDGTLVADGAPLPSGNRGTGAGGSILLNADSVSGSGLIQARGGYVDPVLLKYGPGGGGRIAIHYASALAFPLSNISVRSHTSHFYGMAGAAGTVYLKGPSDPLGSLIVDNENIVTSAGAFPKPTTLVSNLVTDIPSGNVLIRNRGDLHLSSMITLPVGGYWTNMGFLTAADGSTVAFESPAAAMVAGTSTFYNLTCTNAGKSLTFEAGRTNIVRNILTLAGQPGSPVTLRSTLSGTRWALRLLSGGVAHDVQHVDVRDSNASGAAIAAFNSTDSGNNLNWVFASEGQTNTWIGAVNGTWTNSANWSLGRSTVPSDAVIIGPSANPPTLNFDKTMLSLTVQSGALMRLGGYNLLLADLSVQGTLVASNAERLSVSGAVDMSGGVFSNAISTVQLSGTGPQSVTSGSASFRRLELLNTAAPIVFTDGLSATNLHVYGSTATFSGGLACASAFTNQGGQVSVAGAVSTPWFISSGGSLDLAGPVLAGVFRSSGEPIRFGDDVTAVEFRYDGTNDLAFQAGAWVRATNLWINGKSGYPVALRSSSPGNAWHLAVAQLAGVTYVTVSDSDASGGLAIEPILSADEGGNTHWIFSRSAGWMKWTGAVSADFTNAANWSPAAAPGPGSDVFIDGDFGSEPRILQSLAVSNLTIGGQQPVTLTIDAPLTVLDRATVLPNGVLTHSANTTSQVYTLAMAVLGDLLVDGAIDAGDKGYAPSQGPGRTLGNQAGGGHGGMGGYWDHPQSTGPGGNCYGSIAQPVTIGSGGNTGRGAGAIRLTVNGRTAVEGAISASAKTASSSGGGSGGSVWLTTGTLEGSGRIEAEGGRGGTYNGYGYAHGGGGRVAVYLTNSATAGDVRFSAATAVGAIAGTPGGAGTVYLKTPLDDVGTVVVDNANASTPTSVTTQIGPDVGDAVAGDLAVSRQARLQILDNQTLTIYGNLSNSAVVTSQSNGVLSLEGPGPAVIDGSLVLGDFRVTAPGKAVTVAPGKPIVVQGELSLKDVSLASAVPGSNWVLTALQPVPKGNVARVRVSDCDAFAGQTIPARSSVDAGNNRNWLFFNAPGVVIVVQ